MLNLLYPEPFEECWGAQVSLDWYIQQDNEEFHRTHFSRFCSYICVCIIHAWLTWHNILNFLKRTGMKETFHVFQNKSKAPVETTATESRIMNLLEVITLLQMAVQLQVHQRQVDFLPLLWKSWPAGPPSISSEPQLLLINSWFPIRSCIGWKA